MSKDGIGINQVHCENLEGEKGNSRKVLVRLKIRLNRYCLLGRLIRILVDLFQKWTMIFS